MTSFVSILVAEANMENVTIAEAKDHLEELIERVARGADVCIVGAKPGTVRLLLVAADEPRVRKPRRFGLLEGKMTVPVRLLEPMSADELRDWYGDDT
jgi:antitoxin (DNA-binding transcriptional repressor) of toxin-antitoxin stability system